MSVSSPPLSLSLSLFPSPSPSPSPSQSPTASPSPSPSASTSTPAASTLAYPSASHASPSSSPILSTSILPPSTAPHSHSHSHSPSLPTTNTVSQLEPLPSITKWDGLEALEQRIERSLALSWKCSTILEHASAESVGISISTTSAATNINPIKQNFQRQLGEFLTSLRDLDREGRSPVCGQESVPLSLVRLVDLGHDPDTLVGDHLRTLKEKNDKTRGNIFSAKVLRDNLQQRLSEWDRTRGGYEQKHNLLHNNNHSHTHINSHSSHSNNNNSSMEMKVDAVDWQ